MSEQKGSRYHVQYNEGKEFYAEMKNKYPIFDLSAFKVPLLLFPKSASPALQKSKKKMVKTISCN